MCSDDGCVVMSVSDDGCAMMMVCSDYGCVVIMGERSLRFGMNET